MTKGYVLIARGLLKHPRFKPSGPLTQFEAWYWLIESAAYAPHDVTITSGRNRLAVRLEPGQLTYSIRYLARAWQWSDKRVQRFLSALEFDRSVTTQTTTGQTVITLCNWAKYQRPDFETTTQSATATTTATTTNKKERKERKNISPGEEPEGFAAWYATYPKHVDRIDAAKAYARLMRSGTITREALMAVTTRYAAEVAKKEKQFIKAPSVWINKGSYLNAVEGGGEPVPAPIDPRTFTPEQWQRRLGPYNGNGAWSESWGPKPGEPGCLVPSHLILTPVSSVTGAA
jgi:DNA-binding transcriptional regulator YhcF (GntR family)